MQMFYDRLVVPAKEEQQDCLKNKKNVVELQQRFLKLNFLNFSRSYTLRTLAQLFLVVAMALASSIFGFQQLKDNVSQTCS